MLPWTRDFRLSSKDTWCTPGAKVPSWHGGKKNSSTELHTLQQNLLCVTKSAPRRPRWNFQKAADFLIPTMHCTESVLEWFCTYAILRDFMGSLAYYYFNFTCGSSSNQVCQSMTHQTSCKHHVITEFTNLHCLLRSELLKLLEFQLKCHAM